MVHHITVSKFPVHRKTLGHMAEVCVTKLLSALSHVLMRSTEQHID
jgi:hypothetical protein